jgi:hypothetical protein
MRSWRHLPGSKVRSAVREKALTPDRRSYPIGKAGVPQSLQTNRSGVTAGETALTLTLYLQLRSRCTMRDRFFKINIEISCHENTVKI